MLGSLERQAGVEAHGGRRTAVSSNPQNLRGQNYQKSALFPEHRWEHLYAGPQSLFSCSEPIPSRLMLSRNGEGQLRL